MTRPSRPPLQPPLQVLVLSLDGTLLDKISDPFHHVGLCAPDYICEYIWRKLYTHYHTKDLYLASNLFISPRKSQ